MVTAGGRTVKSRRDTLTVIRNAFAGHDRLIEHALREDRSFRDLCRDYARCVAVIEHWQRQPHQEAVARRREYTDLRDELGREIEDRLNTMHAWQPPASERHT